MSEADSFTAVANDPTDPTFTAGWYPDPIGRFELRFYNGVQWTADVASGGARYVDPLGLAVRGNVTNPLATAAMILGIVAVTTAWMPFLVVVGLAAAAIAVGLGIAGVRRSAASGVGRGAALAGLVMGATAAIVSIIGVLLTVVVVDAYRDYVDPPAHEVAVTACSVSGSRATMAGELTNLGDSDAEFSVLVGFLRPDTDNPHATRRVEIGEVAAGVTVVFDAQHQVDLDGVDCAVIEVNGPLPFGIALD